ncbi:hypothetical protein [Bifidobacterium myosotis]|uniref:hypothetical protein n=1 Tax=Bifidobacterium myosotis TaxID=1630166 RepID=UPI00168B255C|nr:hypothetical protein [Bifidobacterium myosotis]
MKSRFMGIGKDRQVRAHFAQTRIGKKWQTAAKHNKSGMAKTTNTVSAVSYAM